MRIHIASEDLNKVCENIKSRLVINANINKTSLNELTSKITETANAIILSNSNIANIYPKTVYKELLIDGKTMCKLIAVKRAIDVIKTIVVDSKKIVISLNDNDTLYVRNNKLSYTSIMGYIAIKGKTPSSIEEQIEYNKNKDYYNTMGVLLNHNVRRRFSWMKSVYRRYRHGLLNCLISDLNQRGIVATDTVEYILDKLKVVRDGPSFYNTNHYIHYLCEIVNIMDTTEKNLFMSLLTDDDGIKFVENYEKTKYLTRRITCQKNDQIKLLSTLENKSTTKMGLSQSQMISTLASCQMG